MSRQHSDILLSSGLLLVIQVVPLLLGIFPLLLCPKSFIYILHNYLKLFNCLLPGFNPAETKIRAPDGKIWHEQGFHIGRELCRDIALQLTGNMHIEFIKQHSLLYETEKY